MAPGADDGATWVFLAHGGLAKAGALAAVDRWQPLLRPRGAASCVTSVLVAEAYNARRARGATSARANYNNLFAYRTVWQGIVGIVAKHDQKETAEKRQSNVTVRWEHTVGGGCIAVLNTTLALRLGEHVDLIRVGTGEDGS